ncbi:MAG: ABC transporter ATP-binding protein [Chloroflexi bacterium]|nr:ABC transporter ATP-binding protein [Chloroflexota bacterium]MBV9603307.1 ABC transporter ATP-binding protein [Chloroflexota bacterium]
MADIVIERLSKTYSGGKAPAVNDLSLTIPDRQFMVLLGPSGCGKTTLLRMVAGLEYPDAGRVMIGGRDVTDLPPRKRDIAMVFQSYAVFPHMTVFDNIGFGLKMKRRPAHEIKQRVEQAAGLLQLEPYLGRYSAQLSGGQRQRVAVARAIVMEPSVLLMDEPLSNLDALLRLQFRAELKKLVKEIQTTTVYVTHDQVEALSLGDRVAVMRAGNILQVDSPMTVYDFPATEFVGGFIGNPPMNFLRVAVRPDAGQTRVVIGDQELPAPAEVAAAGDDTVLLGIRAEYIQASSPNGAALNGLDAQALVVEPLGSHLLITAGVGDQQLKVVTRTDFEVQPGQRLHLQPEVDKIRWLRASDGTLLRA